MLELFFEGVKLIMMQGVSGVVGKRKGVGKELGCRILREERKG